MISRVRSLALRGLEAFPVTVELDVAKGLPGFALVGLPDSAVREARERVIAAVRNSGFSFPKKRVTVNLAPAQARKIGTHLDLPIAVAALCASGQLEQGDWASGCGLLGELALDGALREVPGVLSMALRARAAGMTRLITSPENAAEARAAGVEAVGVRTLREAVEALSGRLSPAQAGEIPASAAPAAVDLTQVKGQALAKRALEIAAAGGHSLLMIGPPGVGKSLLAQAFIGLLPPPSPAEVLEISRLQAAGGGARGLCSARPLRAPHHTASAEALVGGGRQARPGEASLAHGGALFLDELAEFDRRALEALRQPLEAGRVVVSRAGEACEYPARFILIAAANPCPCGFLGHPDRACRCGPAALARYRQRLSGPWLDRIDLQVELASLPFAEWAGGPGPETSAQVRARVMDARIRQESRLGPGRLNARLEPGELPRPEADGLELLEAAARKRALSARSLDRVLKVARTIADLAGEERIETPHLAEALQFKGGFL